MQQKARIWTVPTLILALVLGLSLTAVPAKAQILKDLKELKEIAEDVQCTLGQTGCTQSEEAVSDDGASFPSESATPPVRGYRPRPWATASTP